MNCIPGGYDGDTDEVLPAERELKSALAERVRTRQAAVLYLHAAAMSDDAAERNVLRRRAARLILPDVRNGTRDGGYRRKSDGRRERFVCTPEGTAGG